jgi:3-oxoacyl-[acyl-carrier-protein] synthase-3
MKCSATINHIASYFPELVLTNDELAQLYPEWSADKIFNKTGVLTRRISREDETAADLAYQACINLFSSGSISCKEIDMLLLCTQSPDYFLPTTACTLQHRLNLPQTAGAFDFNLGCSGYIYGLGIAKGFLESGQCKNVILVTSDTYTKYIHPRDKSVRTIFGDGATATHLCNRPSCSDHLASFVYGTNGEGASNLIVPTGAMRRERTSESAVAYSDESGNVRTGDNLYMNGAEIYTFTLKAVPSLIQEVLNKAALELSDINYFVFHQANAYMLESLRKKISIPPEKFLIDMEDIGNTVSSTIPTVIERKLADGTIKMGNKVMLVGFGVGYSWGATIWTV